MARKQQNDPLRYAANLTALAAAVYLGVTALLRLAVGQLLRLFNKSATLENPIAVPEWVLGVFNVLLPAAGLAAAFWLLAVGVRATPMRLRISVQMPRDGRLWLFVPVFLGALKYRITWKNQKNTTLYSADSVVKLVNLELNGREIIRRDLETGAGMSGKSLYIYYKDPDYSHGIVFD